MIHTALHRALICARCLSDIRTMPLTKWGKLIRTLIPARCLNDIRTMLPKILPDCNFNRSLSPFFRDQNVSKSIPLKMTCNTSNSIGLNLLSYKIDFKFLCWFGLAANNRTWSRKYYSDITLSRPCLSFPRPTDIVILISSLRTTPREYSSRGLFGVRDSSF
jgi:hypothetical protein